MISTAKDGPPVLICSKCRRPMTFLATLPAILDLPAIHAFQCRPCLRVDSIPLTQAPRSSVVVHNHDRQ
jgi:hypothetical protein